MATKSMMKSEERVELVLRLLQREEPAAQIARRGGISEQTYIAGAMSSLRQAS